MMEGVDVGVACRWVVSERGRMGTESIFVKSSDQPLSCDGSCDWSCDVDCAESVKSVVTFFFILTLISLELEVGVVFFSDNDGLLRKSSNESSSFAF